MIGRGLTSLALMALILTLDARSLYRKKRWTNYQDSDIREALEELQAKKRTGYQQGYYPSYQQLFSDGPDEATPADMDELKDILSAKSESESEGEISPREMAKLLEEGERLSGDDDSTAEPVSDSELQDIFNAPDDEEEEKKKKREDSKRQDTKRQDDNKEWLMDTFLDNNDNRVDKKKRQTTGNQEPEVASDEMAYMETENALLQKENEYLAGALNAATLGQVEQTNKYMKQQYQYLKQAVETEEALHQLNGEDEEDTKKKRNDHDEEDEEEEKRKRKRVPVKKEEHEEYAQINPLLRKLVDEYSEEQLRRRAKDLEDQEDQEEDKYEQRKKKQDEDDDLPEAPGIGAGPAVLSRPGDEDDEADDQDQTDEDQVENLQTMVANLSPRQRHLMEDEVSTLLESGLLESKCPAVESVADDCEGLMRKYSVELDQQARDVCNRHKVCYSCGSSIDPQKTLNRAACDRIFSEQAKALCGRDEQCHKSATGLFSLMKQQHGYIDWPSPMTAQLCSQKCVVDFLLNGE